jgi:hypothetical protein
VIEIALAPDQVGEEAERERVRLRDLYQGGADFVIGQNRRVGFGERRARALQRRERRILRVVAAGSSSAIGSLNASNSDRSSVSVPTVW